MKGHELYFYFIFAVFGLIGIAAVIGIVYKIVTGFRKAALWFRKLGGVREQAKQEALFRATFPELQPYFHPQNVLQFVSGWRARRPGDAAFEWKDPPGFRTPLMKAAAADEKGRQIELRGVAGLLASFVLQPHPEGAVMRLGAGKFTINVRDKAVRYWHPEREFKWSRAKGWRLVNALSKRPIDSSDRGMTFATDTPSSSGSPGTAAAAGAAAAVVGLGGTFDGGGASAAWDGDSSSRTAY